MPQENMQSQPSADKVYALATIPLVREMAQQYGFGDELQKFQQTLINTVFPSDKVVTHSQFLMFIKVAQNYKLDPLTKQIFAFPSKGGGIVPVVSIDGWIALVQREPKYNGHKFTYEWADGKVGSKLVSATCQIFRKDLGAPIEHCEFMEECVRDTEPWKKWPRRMLTHKSFSQCARYAFGLTGVYDQDEAERIIEAELRTGSDGVMRSEIQMPQRTIQQVSEPGLKKLSPEVQARSKAVIDAANAHVAAGGMLPAEPKTEADTITCDQEVAAYNNAEPEEGRTVFTGITDMFSEGSEPSSESAPETNLVESKPPRRVIGKGKAQRIRAIINTKKTRNEAEVLDLKQAFNIEHLADFPEDRYKELEDWATGKNF